MENRLSKLLSSAEKYRQFKYEVPRLSYCEIELCPKGELLEFSENLGDITAYRIDTPEEDKVAFRMTLKQGFRFEPHDHDCVEDLVVYSGEVYINEIKKDIKSGGRILIPAYKIHTITALKDTVLYVEYYDPQKKC